MSADQAMARLLERRTDKVNASMTRGLQPRLQRSMGVTLKTPTGGNINLVSTDGTVTPEGDHTTFEN